MPLLWRRPRVSAWGVDTRAHARRRPERGGALPHAPIRARSPRAHHVAPTANREAPRAHLHFRPHVPASPGPSRCRVLPPVPWRRGGRCVRGAPAYAARPAVSLKSWGRDSPGLAFGWTGPAQRRDGRAHAARRFAAAVSARRPHTVVFPRAAAACHGPFRWPRGPKS
ncbi:hypothetical protein PVAP13_9KG525726 [Panicum virgatum]|uniref:Uncharacterized protein n=1 Tax=Panicum virgatum TaxID=38727 RepID=A0A8T0NV96_PANVG|nr:hypothetical protein PVAP13_9KG525726 [Panicum virgatum]